MLRAQAQARRSLGPDLRRAFADNEFELYYQPQVRLSDEAVVGAEALLRWRHPERGILAPGAFIDTLAESRDRARRQPLDHAHRLRAARGLARRRASRSGASASTCSRSSWATTPCSRTSTMRLQATRTAGGDARTRNHRERRAQLRTMRRCCRSSREKGVKIAFDDFGTGYASLSYLTRFPLSRIKIDRSFVCKITDDAGDAAIVRSLIAMAHNLGLDVIAEGVETSAQAGFLLNEHAKRPRAISTPSRCRQPISRPFSGPDASRRT